MGKQRINGIILVITHSHSLSFSSTAILEEINYKLTYEDQTLRTFRRAIGFGQNVRSDLIPLLENAKDDAVLESVIRILVNLTVPVECLFSVDVMYRTEVGRHTIFELNKLLYSSKEAFTDPKSTKSVVEYMKHILESEPKLSPHKCDQINNCLLLLRNILHIPETHAHFVMPMLQSSGSHQVSMQNTILWNLFIQSIDKLLLYLMTCPQRAFWGVTMVQLIALIYKDQHVSTLQKLLNIWFEASLSESSEDNESNTSPPKQASGDSSPMLTSDPTSDSSDNGSNGCGSSSKKETSDERRQALREGTDATLQEVSRKGHEYQNAMARVEQEKPDSSEADSTEPGCSPKREMPVRQVMEDIDYETQTQHFEHEGLREQDEELEQDQDHMLELCAQGEDNNDHNMTDFNSCLNNMLNHNYTQPADNVDSTTNVVFATCTTSSASETHAMPSIRATTSSTAMLFEPFKPPLPMRLGDSYNCGAHISAVKLGQKSPHAGQLQLTKGKCCPQKRECPSSQSELSDCGYATQVENQESISTSSNDDDGPQGKPQHQKPPCNTKPRNKQRTLMSPQDKKELRRKKLVKRSKSSLYVMRKRSNPLRVISYPSSISSSPLAAST